MPFDIDFDGVDIKAGGSVIPAGKYNLQIVGVKEIVTKNGDPAVVVNYQIKDGPFVGRFLKFHCITFFKDKGASGSGISKHYLKTIDLPYDGQVRVDPNQWIGRYLVGKVVVEKYKGEDQSRVTFVDKYEVDYTLPVAPTPAQVDDVPF